MISLWGDNGQAALESCRIVLLGATATGTEIIKNLVLPGIGNYTIVDGQLVEEHDLGNNFFVTSKSLGSNRAKVVTELLQELNPYSKGRFVEDDPRTLIERSPEFFLPFHLVIVAYPFLEERHILELGRICWENNIPILIARSYGLIGYLRIVVKDHEIVESNLDNPVEDLRISNPWPELVEFSTLMDINEMEGKMHSHTPWLIILIQFLLKWKETHNGQPPKTSTEKKQFKDSILNAMKEPQEPNFVAALSHAFKAWSPSGVPPMISAILNDDKCVNLHEKSTSFWIIANAVKTFVEKEGQGELPLAGTIPDMESDTDRYVKLQNIFRDKAAQDFKTVDKYVHENLKKLNRLEDEIPEEDVRAFCKNAHNLRVIRTRSLQQEYSPDTANSTSIANALKDPLSTVVFYLLLRACDRFFKSHGCYPGQKLDGSPGLDESEITDLTYEVNTLLSELNLAGTTIPDEYIQEMTRYGCSELHNIGSIVGGVGAQEAIKLITKQRVPLDNTWILCGINSSSNQFEA